MDRRIAWIAFAALATTSCRGCHHDHCPCCPPVDPPVDAGIDGGVDAGLDASVDAGEGGVPCDGVVNPPAGTVCVHGVLEACPVIENLTILPTSVTDGARIAVFAAASDAEDDALNVRWTASEGSFVNAVAWSTDYVCTGVGARTIFVHVDDGPCESSAWALVTCLPR